MHEYSIVQALLGQIEAAAAVHGATGVARVRVALGELSGVEPDLLVTAFATFRECTVAEGAELEIRAVPALWSCPACGAALPRGAPPRCPACERPARLSAGDEIVLEQMELEVPDVRELRLR
jgi:hydrogenase nickel incorporation protein HypA/HybF